MKQKLLRYTAFCHGAPPLEKDTPVSKCIWEFGAPRDSCKMCFHQEWAEPSCQPPGSVRGPALNLISLDSHKHHGACLSSYWQRWKWSEGERLSTSLSSCTEMMWPRRNFRNKRQVTGSDPSSQGRTHHRPDLELGFQGWDEGAERIVLE